MYCINPACPNRQHSEAVGDHCPSCGTSFVFESRYRALRRIAQTQHSEIFEAEVTGEQGQRILKVLDAIDPKQLDLFEREYAVLSWMNHPHIPTVGIDDYFTVTVSNARSIHCLLMEKIEGETLEQWINQNGRASEAIAFQWLLQLTAPTDSQQPEALPGVLAYLHTNRIVHRDIKPSNLIVQPNGELAFIDFGGVKELLDSADFAIAANRDRATVISSPGYSPPEQFNGVALVTSDFYALGRTWVHLLTGRSPIDLIDPKTNQLRWHRHAPQVSKPFAEWLDTMMSASPDQRPRSASAIYRDLTEKLPRQIRLNRLINSWLFRVSIVGATFAIGMSAIWGIQIWRSNEALRRGVQALQAEQYQSARTELETAVQSNDRSAVAHNNLALSCYYLGDDACAIQHYQRAIELSPNYWQAYYNLGSLYDRQERYDLAISQYLKAMNGEIELRAQAVNNLARLKNRQQQYSSAESLVRSVLEDNPVTQTAASLYKNLGWALYGLNRLPEAQAELERALSLDGSRVDTYCLLALVKRSRKLEADAEVKTCLFSATKLPLPEIREWRIQLAQ